MRAVPLHYWLLALAAFFCIAATNTPAQADAPTCYTDRIDSVDVVAVTASGAVSYQRNGLTSPKLKAALFALQGRHMWVGYPKGFVPNPGPAYMWLHIHWTDERGSHTNYLEFALADGYPDYVYMFWYPTLEPNADANGKHWGIHPICGWSNIEIPKATAKKIRQLAGLR